MDKVNSTMEQETKFIEFLGYHLEDCKNYGSWSILDKNNKQIGYLVCSDKKYHTVIDSDNIKYDNEGELNDDFKNFKYKVDGKYKVEQTIKKETYIFRSLRITCDNMIIHLTFSTSGCGHVELVYIINEKGYKMSQLLEYYRDDSPYLSGCYHFSEWFKSENLGVDDERHYITDYKYDMMRGHYSYYSGKHLVENKPIDFDGKADELAKEHGKGIELFNKVREVVNNIIPHDGDVFDDMFGEDTINYYHLNVFFPNCVKEKKK
jgi:hypothetical protein